MFERYDAAYSELSLGFYIALQLTVQVSGVLCLAGLQGWGSIPFHVLCLGGFLTFIALWGLAYAVELSTPNGKENHMSKETVQKTEKPKLILASAMNTTWAIGTGAWSGLALSG